MEKNGRMNDIPFRWLPPPLYNQIRDLGNNQAKSGSESSKDHTKSAKSMAGAAQGAAWSGRTGGCAVKLRESVRAGVAAPSPAKAL